MKTCKVTKCTLAYNESLDISSWVYLLCTFHRCHFTKDGKRPCKWTKLCYFKYLVYSTLKNTSILNFLGSNNIVCSNNILYINTTTYHSHENINSFLVLLDYNINLSNENYTRNISILLFYLQILIYVLEISNIDFILNSIRVT